MPSFTSSLFLLATLALTAVQAHLQITYPGTRGNNLHHNGTVDVDDYTTDEYPYGMQWMYPCGGIKMTHDRNNRTYWPIGGGAVAWQIGWFPGHKSSFQYINLGLNFPNGSAPLNYSHIMNPMFQITGPVNTAFPGYGVCIPQVPTPANITINEGDLATIQIVEAAQHGASLYSCVDIIFTNNMSLVNQVNETNCKNDTELQMNHVYFASAMLNAGWSSAIEARTVGLMSALTLASAAWLLL